MSDGDRGTIFVEKTPFYATSGGQQADTGVIRTADFEFQVEDVKKLLGGKIAHVGHVARGMVKVGDTVTLEIDKREESTGWKKPQRYSSVTESTGVMCLATM